MAGAEGVEAGVEAASVGTGAKHRTPQCYPTDK